MSGEFDRYAKSYDQVLVESMPEGLAEDGYFARYKVDLMARLLRGRGAGTLLDFGCGTGRSLAFIRAAFPIARLTGFDESAESIAVAAGAVPDARLTCSWPDIEAQSFDAVFAANVFHHIAPGERLAWLERCARVLSPEGRLFWFEHNPLNPLTRRVFERCPFDVGASMIPRAEALPLMEKAGLQVVRTGYTLFFPRPLALLRPLEPLLAAVPLGAQYYIEAARCP
ncbi:MAG: class I SAM-dependent methyltransferase [Usitatibacter sp.]